MNFQTLKPSLTSLPLLEALQLIMKCREERFRPPPSQVKKSSPKSSKGSRKMGSMKVSSTKPDVTQIDITKLSEEQLTLLLSKLS